MSGEKAIADRIWLFEKLGKFWEHDASRDFMLNSFFHDRVDPVLYNVELF